MVKQRPYIMKLMVLVLQNTSFILKGRYYPQTWDTSVGTRFVPIYINIFMGNVEESLLVKYPLNWEKGPLMTFFSYREKFMEYMNTIYSTIKFTCDNSDTQIVFLSILVKIEPDTRKPYIILYSKPIDL